MMVLAGLLVVLLVVLPEGGNAGAQAPTEQAPTGQTAADLAAADLAAAEASAPLARVAEISASAAAAKLLIEANSAAAEAAVRVQEETTRLALDAALTRRMNDLRVFAAGLLVGTAAVGLPTLAALALLRLLLGAGWQQRLIGRASAPSQPAVPPVQGAGLPTPPAARRAESPNGHPVAEPEGPPAGVAGEQTATPDAGASHRRYQSRR
jgi:hypothetical protein